MGGQEMAMATTVTVTERDGAWAVSQSSESPMGPFNDTVTLEKGTLVARKRSLRQGQISADIDYSGGHASGKLNLPNGEQPVNTDLGGPVFAEGPGAGISLACLPLAEGYTATYRNYDLTKMKAALWQMKVTGSESVTVPAGKFDTFKVEAVSADGGSAQATFWVSKDSHEVVKSFTSGSGGATFTAELQ
jgi:hypothetical protein